MAGHPQVGPRRRPESRDAQDPLGGLADEDRHRRIDLRDETVMIGMAVRDDQPGERRIGIGQPGDRWQRDVGVEWALERASEIEQKPGAVMLEFDACTADLPRAAVYPCA